MSNVFEIFLNNVGKIPKAKVARDDFLKSVFEHRVADRVMLERVVKEGPIRAGVSAKVVSKVADDVITSTVRQATVISFVGGLPGGAVGLAAIPADIMQLYVHIFVVVQKLMYLYGWEEDVFDREGNLDDGTKSTIMLYIGLMMGISTVAKPLGDIAGRATKSAILSVLKKHPIMTIKFISKIAKAIGVKTVGKFAVKTWKNFVPILGGGISAALTYGSFVPMAKKLKKYFETGKIELGNDIETEEE